MISLRYLGESWGWKGGSGVKMPFSDKHEHRSSGIWKPRKSDLTVIPGVKKSRPRIPRTSWLSSLPEIQRDKFN